MKKILIVGLILVGLAGVVTGADAFNQPVVDKLVERFNLNEDEVAGVFDEARQERRQEMQEQRQEHMEERLDEAVGDGVITADQKQALLNKRAEMQEKREQLREEMRTWMDENGFDCETLAPYCVGYGGRGFGPGKVRGFGGW